MPGRAPATKRVAAMLGLDPKTVRRYLKVAAGVGLTPGSTVVGEVEVTAVLLALHPAPDPMTRLDTTPPTEAR